jgi:acyl carrier protein phosphodiesterase
MNYLAHIFLSGSDRRLQLGNFIGDFVKGNSYLQYPDAISKGILLHRKIDKFTDSHAIYREIIENIRPEFGRYAGIMADMYSDYFLATDFSMYSPKLSLRMLSYNFYFNSLYFYRYLPSRVKKFIFHFITTDRLRQYANHQGLYDSLKIMSEYKSPAIKAMQGVDFLISNENLLRKKFHLFMPQVIQFANEEKIKFNLYDV